MPERTTMKANLHPGARVKYRAEFLRSIGCYTGALPFARGTITALVNLGSQTTLADVAWDRPGVPGRVNVANLMPAGSPG
jgi:hypothetical protein